MSLVNFLALALLHRLTQDVQPSNLRRMLGTLLNLLIAAKLKNSFYLGGSPQLKPFLKHLQFLELQWCPVLVLSPHSQISIFSNLFFIILLLLQSLHLQFSLQGFPAFLQVHLLVLHVPFIVLGPDPHPHPRFNSSSTSEMQSFFF